MYNLIEYSENYSKKSGSLQQFYRDGRDGDDKIQFEPFKYKAKITGSTSTDGNQKHVEIPKPLKNLTFKIALINYQINLILTWSANFSIFKFSLKLRITDGKPYLSVETLAIQ